MRFIFLIIMVLLLNFSKAQNIPSIQTDRPDQTECPFIVPKKNFQAEIGFAYEKVGKNSSSVLLPSCLFKFGISDKTELRLITEVEQLKQHPEKKTGLNPVVIGFKTNILQEKGMLPTISFIGHLSLPNVASCENKADFFAPAFRFTMQHTLSSKVALGYNLGAEWDGFTPEPTFIYTVTTGISLSEKFGCYAELYGFAPQKSTADHYADAGFTFLLNNDILFDVAAGIGLTPAASTFFIGTGFSFRLR